MNGLVDRHVIPACMRDNLFRNAKYVHDMIGKNGGSTMKDALNGSTYMSFIDAVKLQKMMRNRTFTKENDRDNIKQFLSSWPSSIVHTHPFQSKCGCIPVFIPGFYN